MKKKPVCTYLVFAALMAFVSCSRQDQPLQQSNRPLPPHPLAGTEIQFDSLFWQREDHIENVFISIGNRPGIFLYSSAVDVSLKLDTSSTWIVANTSSGFVYYIGAGRFYIAPVLWSTALENTYASVKIKFLR